MRAAIAVALAAGATFAFATRSHASIVTSGPAATTQRPNPALEGFRLDYVAPPRSSDGGVASFAPLRSAVLVQAVRDEAYLRYKRRDDLGGFRPAPLGGAPLVGVARAIVGSLGNTQLPLFREAAGGSIASFTSPGVRPGTGPRPDNGRGTVPGLGTPVSPPPPSATPPPPANQGFGGRPAPGGTTTTPTTAPPTTTPPPTTPPATTTVPRTTPVPTTTAVTTTTVAATTTAGGGTTTITTPPPPQQVECGAAGISILSNLSGCHIDAVDMAPGGSTTETVTITNTSASTYVLSLKAAGTQNALWRDMEMGVYERGTPAPTPLPPLLDWTTQFNDLTTLAPGQSVTYVVELYLSLSAGNADQGLTARINFIWKATG